MKYFVLVCLLAFIQSSISQVVINELDADNPGTDNKEFVELKSSTPNFSLNGYVLVFFNGGSTGTTNVSYLAYDLDGYTTDINGIFLLGSSQVVPTPTLVIPNSVIQNGPDVVALYLGNESDFPLNTVGTTTNLVDALAYSTSASSTPSTLMTALGIATNNLESSTANVSIQRNNDGSYVTTTPTPGQNNDGSGVVLNTITITPSATVINEGDSVSFTYTAAFPVTGSNLIINVIVNNGTFNLLDIDGALTTFIPVGQTSVIQTFTVVDDDFNEGDEELRLQVQALPSGYVLNNNFIVVRVNESNFDVMPWGTPAAPTYGLVAPTIPSGYYTTLEGLSGAALKQELQNIIANPSVVRAHNYGDVWEMLRTADQNPQNSSQVWLIYNEVPRSKLDQQTESSIVGKWNREHIYPQSRGNYGDLYNFGPDGITTYLLSNPNDIDAGLSDGHHLRAVDGQENSSRNNRDYGLDYNGPAGNPGTWRGDVARALFYMAVRYNGLAVVNGNPPDTTIGQMGDLATLLSWNFLDPADDFEMNRNNYIYTWQYNRNPFIDYPLLANYVFGANFGQPWFSSLTVDSQAFDSIKVCPNPVKDHFFVSGINEEVTVTLTTMSGQLIGTQKHSQDFKWDVSLASGIYIITIKSASKSVIHKLVVP